jgi:hypothetical protein
MLMLVRMYVAIAFGRRGPQDLPAVGILLPLTMAAYVLVSVAAGALVPQLRSGWALQVLADAGFLAVWYWLLLALAQRRERYLQTAAALFGLQTVLAAPNILSAWLLQQAPSNSVWLTVAYVIALAVLIWTVIAIAQVLRAALERPLGWCLLVAFVQLLSEGLLWLALFDHRR